MTESKWTPGPWEWDAGIVPPDGPERYADIYVDGGDTIIAHFNDLIPEGRANARLIAAAPDMVEALYEGRRAIGDHFAPNDCYATGPLTGDPFRDLVQCPACSFIAMYDAVISRTSA